jgi:hypothetical protein
MSQTRAWDWLAMQNRTVTACGSCAQHNREMFEHNRSVDGRGRVPWIALLGYDIGRSGS